MKRTKCLLSTRKLISLAKIHRVQRKGQKTMAAGTAILIVTGGDQSKGEGIKVIASKRRKQSTKKFNNDEYMYQTMMCLIS